MEPEIITFARQLYNDETMAGSPDRWNFLGDEQRREWVRRALVRRPDLGSVGFAPGHWLADMLPMHRETSLGLLTVDDDGNHALDMRRPPGGVKRVVADAPVDAPIKARKGADSRACPRGCGGEMVAGVGLDRLTPVLWACNRCGTIVQNVADKANQER